MNNTLMRVLTFVLFCLLGISAQAETHPIKKGDKLEKIAKAHNTTVKSLMEHNKWIKNPNVIQIGKLLEVPAMPTSVVRVTTKVAAKSTARPVAHATAKAVVDELQWINPNAQQCVSCDLSSFLAANYPEDVAQQLQQQVAENVFENIDIASGEQFEVMLSGQNHPRKNVIAAWTDGHTESARLYGAAAHGMAYWLVYPNVSGNWAKIATTEDLRPLIAIRRALEEIAGAPYDMMPLAIIIWKYKSTGIPPPEKPDWTNSMFADPANNEVWFSSDVAYAPLASSADFFSALPSTSQGVTQ